ncbi:O-antigen ligase family protein [Chryseobacterium sp. CBSDS_008]|uniref:O-antigen ligase family protein n=1 Tax=Chryseobacterium sp. CBSDS_008 TaxID=3415265 RepID=UPI003CE98D1D
MYGHIGASLFIISLFLLLFCKKDYTSYFLFFCLFLGLFNVIQSMARSPLVAISVCSFYMVLLKGNKKYMLYAVTSVLLFIGLIILHEQYGNGQITSFNRMYKWIAHGDTSSREPLYSKAVEIFNSNRFLGGRILFEDGVHPHNIFLELLMATGVLGLIIYFLKFLPVVQNASIFWNIKKSNIYYKLIFALFLQYFTLVQTSCNLFNIPEFLYFSSMIIGISYTAKSAGIRVEPTMYYDEHM